MNLLKCSFCANSPRIGAKLSEEKMVVVPGRAAGDALAYDRKSIFWKTNEVRTIPKCQTYTSWTARGLAIPEGTNVGRHFTDMRPKASKCSPCGLPSAASLEERNCPKLYWNTTL